MNVVLSRVPAKAEPKRIIGPPYVLAQPIDRIKPKPIGSAIEPEFDDVPHGRTDGGILPIEIRLFLQEGMKIVLPASSIPTPGGAAESGIPVTWWPTEGLAVCPT